LYRIVFVNGLALNMAAAVGLEGYGFGLEYIDNERVVAINN